MFRYQARRHRHLMDESEQALSDAAESACERHSRIAKQVLDDSKVHRLWESRHADLILPVSEHSRRAPQVLALRDAEVKLVHRRALIRHIRTHRIVGEARNKLLAAFYGPRETTGAILAEHRQYTLAVSSRLSTDHLINVMCDPVSTGLLKLYDQVYSKYFELYCFVVCCDDEDIAEASKVEMLTLRRRAMSMIRHIHSAPPDNRYSNFERQALLARSGRYPVLNYMVG